MCTLNNIGHAIELGIKFILEVPGAIGAVWGPSEALGLRNSADPINNNCWRAVALLVGAVALVRFICINTNLPASLCGRAQAEAGSSDSTQDPVSDSA